MSMSRHEVRKVAFQTLFALNSNPDANPTDVYEALLGEETAAPAYLIQLVDGVRSKQTEIDELISAHLKKGWPISRLNKTDLILMRLAVYEMKFVDDLPAKVALNEALELSKEFSDETSRRFINGVLSNLL
ncbi:NusB antitermination factor [Ligilactobacillus sp. WC1T17]|uniref:Transcription antitermination protein NusB n=1 Tax=Ligilactobacillus ruminis TaxID=1623 RepID=A0ABY1A9I6_9LACO|nr:NusB antitermination factor [Ligilactobacillus ruminis]